MRFTIRDVLWLTVVVALGVAWWLDRTHLAARHHPYEAQEEFDRAYLEVLRYKEAQLRKQPSD